MTLTAPPLTEVEPTTTPRTVPDRREHLLDLVVVSIACVVFLAISLYQLDLPGLYTDEAYDVIPAMQMVLGHRVELQGEVLDLGGLRLPLMSSSAYQGVTYTYLAVPFFALGGVNVISLRLMTVLVGVAGIILSYFLAKSWFGRDVGRITALLLAFSPAWVFWSRLGVYVVSVVMPIASGALLAFTFWVRSHRKKRYGSFYLGMFLLGLGLTTKLLFLWFISALFIALFVLWGRVLWNHRRLIRRSLPERLRVVAFGAFSFCLGALPFILYNILTRGTINLLRQTLSGPGTTTHGVDNTAVVRNLWTEVDAFKVLLDGGYFWFQGVNQQPHANPLAPLLFAVSVLGLLALMLARRTSGSEPQVVPKALRLPALLLLGGSSAALTLAFTSATGSLGMFLIVSALLLTLSGVGLLMWGALRSDAFGPAAWILLVCSALMGAIWWFGGGGRPEGRAPDAFLGLWPIDAAGLVFWITGAGLMLLLGADRNPVPFQRPTVATLTLIGLLIAQSTVTVSGLWSTHLLIVLPLPQMLIGAFAILLTRTIRQRLPLSPHRNALRPLTAIPAALIVSALLVGDGVVDLIYHNDLKLTGGASTFSDAIYSLERYLETEKAGYKVVAMDWGFRRPLQFLSSQRIDPIEGYGLAADPPPEFFSSLREFLKDDKTIYLFHTEMGTAYHRREAFLNEVAAAGKEAIPDATFKHRDGIPVYELFTVR